LPKEALENMIVLPLIWGGPKKGKRQVFIVAREHLESNNIYDLEYKMSMKSGG